ITSLSTTAIGSFTLYMFYASARFCQPSETLMWSCGANREANPLFKPVVSGGDGSDVQFHECCNHEVP
ncbi:uncharacterized protein PHACADRAFT_104542, partial [Phanerochaete carnosa HHB-10118-sp]